MNIQIDKETSKNGEEFYLHFSSDPHSSITFSASPNRLCMLLTKPELEQLAKVIQEVVNA